MTLRRIKTQTRQSLKCTGQDYVNTPVVLKTILSGQLEKSIRVSI